MNRFDFGRLVASLRREHENERGRLWSQDRLAKQANLAIGAEVFNAYVISNIERGRRNLDPDTVVALADALELTTSERREFFLAASGIENEGNTRADNDPETVLSQLINKIGEVNLPAFVGDCYYDMVAVNAAMIVLMDLESAGLGLGSQEVKLFPYNMVRFIFSGEESKHIEQLMGNTWPRFLSNTMLFFRAATLRYRCTEYYQRLITELRKFRLFRRYWEITSSCDDDHFADTRITHFNSPKWGLLSYAHMPQTALTKAGELILFVYVPTSYSTAEAFASMADVSSPRTNVLRIGSWPNKEGMLPTPRSAAGSGSDIVDLSDLRGVRY